MKQAQTETALTDYQVANLSLWSRTQMVEFLMSEGLRGPRRVLRNKSTEWLMQACIEEGALLCGECLEETDAKNPILETGLCERCQVKVDEENETCNDPSCACVSHN